MMKYLYRLTVSINILTLGLLFVLLPAEIVVSESPAGPETGHKAVILLFFLFLQFLLALFFAVAPFFVKFPFDGNRMNDLFQTWPWSAWGFSLQKQSPEYRECLRNMMLGFFKTAGVFFNIILFLILFSFAMKNSVPPIDVSDDFLGGLFVGSFLLVFAMLFVHMLRGFLTLKRLETNKNTDKEPDALSSGVSG